MTDYEKQLIAQTEGQHTCSLLGLSMLGLYNLGYPRQQDLANAIPQPKKPPVCATFNPLSTAAFKRLRQNIFI